VWSANLVFVDLLLNAAVILPRLVLCNAVCEWFHGSERSIRCLFRSLQCASGAQNRWPCFCGLDYRCQLCFDREDCLCGYEDHETIKYWCQTSRQANDVFHDTQSVLSHHSFDSNSCIHLARSRHFICGYPDHRLWHCRFGVVNAYAMVQLICGNMPGYDFQ